MTVLICFLLPPVFLMFMRDKLLGEKISCSFHGEVKAFLREYLLSVLFLNFIVFAVTYKLFHHDGALDSALMEYTDFAFHYLALSIVTATIEPVIENILRFHVRVKIDRISFSISACFVLYAYAFVLFMMNFIRIFDNAFWGDEGYSIRLAQMTVQDMVAATASDVHPPLYYLLAQILYHVVGNNGIAYHLSGLVPYAVILIISCTIIKKYFGFIPSAAVITMSSLMKNAVQYNVEARMYALAALFVLVAYIAFYKVIEKNRLKDWILFCLSSLGAAYTHYYALISVAFLYVMIIPLAISKKKYRKGFLISYLATIVGYLPWLMVLFNSFVRTANGWWLENIPKISECYMFLLDYNWLAVFSLCCILLCLVYQLKLLNIKISSTGSLKDRVDFNFDIPEKIMITKETYWLASGLISVCGTVAVGLILSYTIRPLFVLRYLFPVSAMFYLIIGVCISKMNLRRTWLTVLIVAILCNNVPAYAQKYIKEHNLNTETAKFLDAVKPESDAKLISNNSHLAWTLLEYYYPENARQYDEEAPYHLDMEYEDIWLFWTNELNELEMAEIKKQQYTLTKMYEGYFANGVFYHVYQLQYIDNM